MSKKTPSSCQKATSEIRHPPPPSTQKPYVASRMCSCLPLLIKLRRCDVFFKFSLLLGGTAQIVGGGWGCGGGMGLQVVVCHLTDELEMLLANP